MHMEIHGLRVCLCMHKFMPPSCAFLALFLSMRNLIV